MSFTTVLNLIFQNRPKNNDNLFRDLFQITFKLVIQFYSVFGSINSKRLIFVRGKSTKYFLNDAPRDGLSTPLHYMFQF